MAEKLYKSDYLDKSDPNNPFNLNIYFHALCKNMPGSSVYIYRVLESIAVINREGEEQIPSVLVIPGGRG